MKEEQIIDVTGTPLTPSRQGRKCLGNGEHPEYECCCDNCNYFLYCFPQYDWRLTEAERLTLYEDKELPYIDK